MVLLIHDREKNAVNIKKVMRFDEDLFIRARDFYHDHEDMRREHILVTDEEGREVFELYYKENRLEGAPKGMNIPTYVNPYWNYAMDSENMDFSYISEHDIYFFEEVEEYSLFSAQLIRERFPDKVVVFLDERARYFMKDIDIVRDRDEYLALHPQYKDKNILYVQSTLDIGRPVKDTTLALSAMLMASVFWASDLSSYGERNPDKTFYLIKPIIGESGLAKFIEFTIGFYDLALRKREQGIDIIPVVDTGIMGDDNQFSGGNGADVWAMFFEPLSPYDLREVYDSKRVIVSEEGNTSVNPYLLEIKRHPNVSPLIRKYVHFNAGTSDYVERLYMETIPENPGRVLGVVGRGTDFNHPVIARYRQKPLSPDDLLKKTRERFIDGGFDRIFLATEDQRVYDLFMKSDIRDRVYSVPQKRYTLNFGSGDDRLLSDVYKEQESRRDGYRETLKYLGILYILSRCDALIASTECGATIFAEGYKKTRYEFTDIYGQTIYGKR